jgi:DNA-binding response OmpR family regulator
MSNLNNTIKNFTPNEYRDLTVAQINEMMDNNIPFKVSNVYKLDHEFSYCLGTQTLYKNDEVVSLTKLENKLIALLINSKEVVTIEKIKNDVWKGKEMTVFTMRNVIKKIRDKTYYEIIKSKSGWGYSIWTKEIL